MISSIFILIISLIFENSLNEYGIFDSTRELEEWFYCFIACLIGTVYYITLFYMMDSGLSSSLIMYQNYKFLFYLKEKIYIFFFLKEIIQSI